MDGEMKIELKYCERCGGLWLRRAGVEQVYCGSCAPAMQDVALPSKKKPGRPHLPVFEGELGGASCA